MAILTLTPCSLSPLTIFVAVFASRLSTIIVGSCSSAFFSFNYGSKVSVPDITFNSILCDCNRRN